MYWQNNATLEHLTPPGERWPEEGLKEALQAACYGTVLEIGSGDGRLSPWFDPQKYIGVDINPAAVQKARINNPEYQYLELPCTLPPADTVLLHTVALHIPDTEFQELVPVLKQYPRVVISEILGRKYRREGDPPVYNRDLEEYIQWFGTPEIYKVPYPRYKTNLQVLVWKLSQY